MKGNTWISLLLLNALMVCVDSANYTVVFGNVQHNGHYLHAEGALVTVKNPAITDKHKWTFDWESAFGASGTTIENIAGRTIMTPLPFLKPGAVNMAPMAVAGVANGNPNWKIKAIRNGTVYTYQVMDAGTPTVASIGCLDDIGSAVQVRVCSDSPQQYWHIYKA